MKKYIKAKLTILSAWAIRKLDEKIKAQDIKKQNELVNRIKEENKPKVKYKFPFTAVIITVLIVAELIVLAIVYSKHNSQLDMNNTSEFNQSLVITEEAIPPKEVDLSIIEVNSPFPIYGMQQHPVRTTYEEMVILANGGKLPFHPSQLPSIETPKFLEVLARPFVTPPIVETLPNTIQPLEVVEPVKPVVSPIKVIIPVVKEPIKPIIVSVPTRPQTVSDKVITKLIGTTIIPVPSTKNIKTQLNRSGKTTKRDINKVKRGYSKKNVDAIYKKFTSTKANYGVYVPKTKNQKTTHTDLSFLV